MSIAKLKRERASMIEKISSAMKDSGDGSRDPRIWKLFLDKEKGTGFAKIRFLPAPDGEDVPFVKRFDHFFKGPTGKYYAEGSLTTLKQPDPCQELVGRCFNSGIDSDQAAVRKAKLLRITNFYANVLVIEDPANKSNEGKVFLYRFGAKIYEMLEAAMSPEFEDSKPLNPFDLWDGANFTLRIRMVKSTEGDFWNYDKSSFDDKGELFPGDDDAKEKVWKTAHSLKEFIDPTKFKSYDDLKRKLVDVLGPYFGSGIEVGEGVVAEAKPTIASAASPAARFAEKVQEIEQPKVQVPKAEVKATATLEASSGADEDDDLAFFMKAAK